MNHETSEDTVNNLRDLENKILIDTHERESNIIVYEVEDLLSCINIWKKEMKENQKVSNNESLQNIQTPSFNLSKLYNDSVKKYNISINDNLLKLAGFKTNDEEEIIEMTKDYKDNDEMTNKIISNLNYPLELSYEKIEINKKRIKEDGTISESSSDTRYGTDESDSSNNNYNKITVRLENEANKDSIIKEYKGKKIDPKLKEINSKNIKYSLNDNEKKHVEYNTKNYAENNKKNYEINSFEIKNDNKKEMEEFKEIIGELIKGENYQINEIYKNQIEDQKEIIERQEEYDSELIGDNVQERDEEEEEEEELENEENPILLMKTIEDAIITENDILRYGKSESNIEIMITNTKEKEKSKDVIKNAIIKSQINQILNNKEDKEESNIYEKVRGVCYCKSDNSWTAWWTEKGKSRKKAFKLSLYGNDEARRKAIEHRRYVEEMIPDLKEKKVKSSKKKINGNKIINDNNMEEILINDKKEINKIEKLLNNTKEEGIYKGTRKRQRETNEEEGIYFKENTWYSTWINPMGNKIVNSFPVTKEMPFIEAKTKALNLYTINKLNYPNNNINNNNSFIINNTNINKNNNNYYYYKDIINENNYYYKDVRDKLYKKRKSLIEKEEEREQILEHFNILERKLQEEIEKNKINEKQYYKINQSKEKGQNIQKPEIYMENIQEFKIPGGEENNGQETKFKSQHCFIKLEKSIVEEIEKAINKSLNELNQNKNDNINNKLEDDKVEDEKKELENISALCITQTKDEKRSSINIIPTYVRRPDDTQLITFVILNS